MAEPTDMAYRFKRRCWLNSDAVAQHWQIHDKSAGRGPKAWFPESFYSVMTEIIPQDFGLTKAK